MTRHAAVAVAVIGLVLSACDDEIDIGEVQTAPGSITILDTVGPQGQTGWWPSLVVDDNDQPHLSFCDAYYADLKYATRVGKQWRVRSVISKGKVGKYTAIDVDSKGRVGIAFYDQDMKYLRYVYQTDAGEWKDERVAWGLEVGMAGELRFDADDVPHIFYYLPSGKLIHAQKPADAKWQKEVVAEVTGGFSVRISPVLRDDGFWISFVDWNFTDTALHLGRQTAKGFDVEMISAKRGPGWRSQLMFERDEPLVIYSQSFGNTMRIARRKGGEWSSALLLRRAANFAATMNPRGDVIVAYEDVTYGSAGDGTLKYLRRRDGAWSRFDVDAEGPAGSHLALASDSKGRPIIAYFSATIRGLKIYDETIDGQASVLKEQPPPAGR